MIKSHYHLVKSRIKGTLVTYSNTVQSYTLACEEGYSNNSYTATVPPGTYTSYSQADADRIALQAAINEAKTSLVCSAESLSIVKVDDDTNEIEFI